MDNSRAIKIHFLQLHFDDLQHPLVYLVFPTLIHFSCQPADHPVHLLTIQLTCCSDS